LSIEENGTNMVVFLESVIQSSVGQTSCQQNYTLCSEKKTSTHIFFHISMSDM